MGQSYCTTLNHCRLAELELRAGHRDDAAASVATAASIASETGERLWQAEIHRLEGLVHAARRPADTDAVEASYRRAVEVARDQGASLLALRAAVALGGLLGTEGRQPEARSLLTEAVKAIRGGDHEPDVVAAASLLRELD